MNADFQVKAVWGLARRILPVLFSCCDWESWWGFRNDLITLTIATGVSVHRFVNQICRHVTNKATCFQCLVWRHKLVKNTTVSVILLRYRASAEETFKGHSVGRAAKDMHRSLWRKHDYRVRNKIQQAHRVHLMGVCERQNLFAGVSAIMRGKWAEHFGCAKLKAKMRHLPFGKKRDDFFNVRMTADINTKPSVSHHQHYESSLIESTKAEEDKCHFGKKIFTYSDKKEMKAKNSDRMLNIIILQSVWSVIKLCWLALKNNFH